MPARLTLFFPDRPARSFLLSEDDPYTVGRDPQCRIELDDERISRRHAELVHSDLGWRLTDLGSKNGTAIEGRAVESVAIESGHWISFGGLVASFETISVEESERRKHLELEKVQSSLTLRSELTPARGLDDLLDKILTSALSLSDAERAFVMLRDHRGELTVAASSGIGADALAKSEFAGSVGALERALTTGQAVVAADTRADEFLGVRPSIVSGRISSLACVPLVALDKTLGVIYLDSRKPGSAFSELDMEILEALASHAALAVAVTSLDSEARGLGGELPTRLAPARRGEDEELTWSRLRALHSRAAGPEE